MASDWLYITGLLENEMADMHDFDGSFSQTYKEKCECGKEIEVSTQEDSDPEYYTSVFVRCDCGKSVPFMLPVN